jgi:hypothetical protein
MIECIGKKIVAIKGWTSDRRKKKIIEPSYVLFDDEETYLELEDQDYHTYHDCDSSAKTIEVRKDNRIWKLIFDNESGNYPDATVGTRGY